VQRIKVAVLRGGPSSEYEVSLKTGRNVLDNLSDKYIPIDVFISKDGNWHIDGAPVTPYKIFENADVVFNAMHGEYGEDGKVQQLMDKFGVKYTGSKALASAIGMNKVMAKEIFRKSGLKTPVFKIIQKGAELNEESLKLFKTFPMPAIIKPNGSGSSLGVSIVGKLDEIKPALEKAFEHSDVIIAEEFIIGREASCGVIENFRDQEFYSLLPTEIKTDEKYEFYSYEAKNSGESKQICPGNFSPKETETIKNMAAEAHRLLGLRHYSRADFIVSPKRGVYILEVNTLPGLTKESIFIKELEAVGCSFPYFLDHVLTLALEKN